MYSRDAMRIQEMARDQVVSVFVDQGQLRIVPTDDPHWETLCASFKLVGIYHGTPQLEWIEEDIRQALRMTASQRAKVMAKMLLD